MWPIVKKSVELTSLSAKIQMKDTEIWQIQPYGFKNVDHIYDGRERSVVKAHKKWIIILCIKWIFTQLFKGKLQAANTRLKLILCMWTCGRDDPVWNGGRPFHGETQGATWEVWRNHNTHLLSILKMSANQFRNFSSSLGYSSALALSTLLSGGVLETRPGCL